MPTKLLITSYTNPDLDATACAIAYAEFLNKTGRPAEVGLFGNIHQEAQFVLQYFQIEKPLDAEGLINNSTEVVLVDASDTSGISAKLNPDQVVEIIDHRKLNEAAKFAEAKVQIELVGSAATLIAEKYYDDEIEMSSHSAALLYSAIVSNTVNFQADVTTERDRKMAEWLRGQLELPTDYIRQIFAAKSHFDQPLKEVIEGDFAVFTFNGRTVGIAQLEILDVAEFISSTREELEVVLTELKASQNLDYIFLTTIDLEKATNTFFIIDDQGRELLEVVLGLKFIENIAVRSGIMMRKTIGPLIKQHLEK